MNHPSSASQSGFQTRRVLAVSLAHFVHDTYTAFLAPLLPLLIQRLQLSLALAGSLTFFLQVPSLLNPVIGYLDDRLNLRCLVYIAPGLTGTLMSCLGFAGSYWSLAGLLLATGLMVLEVKKLPVADYLPAIFLPPILVWLVEQILPGSVLVQ